MRTISDDILTIIRSGNINGFILVSIKSDKISMMHTSLPYDIYIENLGTFESNNTLVSVDAPKQSSVVDREAYKITYADPDFIFRDYFELGLVGTPVNVYTGFFNTSDIIMGNTAPGQPFTNYSDVVHTYSGIIDSYAYTTNNDDEVLVAFECSSPMANLAMTRTKFTSQDSIRQVDPTDTAFDQVFVGSKTVNYLWGKA